MTRQKSLVRSNEARASYREQAGSGEPVEQEKVKEGELESRMVGMGSSSSVASVCTTSPSLPFLTVHSPSSNGDLPLEARFEGRYSEVSFTAAILRGGLTTRGILKCREGSLETPSLTMGEKSKVKASLAMSENLWGCIDPKRLS